MRTFFKFPALICLLLFLASCQDVVQVKLDQGSKLYVIDAFVTNLREAQRIRVSTNSGYFSDGETPPVANAIVTLKDLTSGKNYSFPYTGNDGYYQFNLTSADTVGIINHQYQLSVVLDGYTYTSLAVEKRAASIDSVYTVYEDGSGGFGQTKTPYYRCQLAAKDRADATSDYYWIKTFRNDTLFDSAGDLNLSIDGTTGEVTNFSKDSLSFTPPVTFLGFKRYQTGDSCRVQIHSITRETEAFLNQAVAQINNGGLFALTPENVKTNIVTPANAKTKAIGWFSVATVVSKAKLVK